MQLMIMAFFLYYITMVFEAPIRYFLGMLGIPYVLYIRDLLLIILLVVEISKTRCLIYFEIFGIIVIYSLIGLWYTENLNQVLWGIKTIYPLFFGMCAYEYYIKNIAQYSKIYAILFFSSCVGLLLHWYLGDPFWTHMPDNELTNIENVRNWSFSYDGDVINRLGGFSRTSIDVAALLSIGVLYLISFSRWYLIYGGILIGALMLTTTKANIVAAVLLFCLLIVKLFNKKIYLSLLKISAILSILLMIIVPIFSTEIINIISSFDYGTMYVLLLSLGDRIVNTWPASLDIISNYGSYVLGRGIGGIGFSTVQFEKIAPNPIVTDSSFLYLYGSIGILGIIFLAMLIWKIYESDTRYNRLSEFMLLVIYQFFLIGVTTDMLNQVVLLHLGLALRWAINARRFCCSTLE